MADLLAQLVECRADNVKVLSSILSCDMFVCFLLILPKGRKIWRKKIRKKEGVEVPKCRFEP